MKLKINKACDLSSISALPPRRWSGKEDPFSIAAVVLPGHVSLSQLSQRSFEKAIQRCGSQEKGWSHWLQLHRQERNLSYIFQGQLEMCADRMQPLSRITDAIQVSEELEHKLQLIESSLNRVGMILVSVQGDVMQVNKAIKELSLEAEGIRQKISLFDNSMHQLPKWEDDIKSFLGRSITSISDQLSNNNSSCKVHEIASVVRALQEQICAHLA
ncbi:hypothetical protein C4D60_Mb11t03500 [Musa balbisiana]|uniref:Uncharacterized protein n=1 Tax=Musa balbisiana TaxID=52838 RepID=A0A4S8J1F7_MUSBA|nr:hypothetical protein C4D60_Mb11t03500 [Musa balbisiana]